MFLLVPAYPVSAGQKAVKRLCVCACVRVCMCVVQIIWAPKLHFYQNMHKYIHRMHCCIGLGFMKLLVLSR